MKWTKIYSASVLPDSKWISEEHSISEIVNHELHRNGLLSLGNGVTRIRELTFEVRIKVLTNPNMIFLVQEGMGAGFYFKDRKLYDNSDGEIEGVNIFDYHVYRLCKFFDRYRIYIDGVFRREVELEDPITYSFVIGAGNSEYLLSYMKYSFNNVYIPGFHDGKEVWDYESDFEHDILPENQPPLFTKAEQGSHDCSLEDDDSLKLTFNYTSEGDFLKFSKNDVILNDSIGWTVEFKLKTPDAYQDAMLQFYGSSGKAVVFRLSRDTVSLNSAQSFSQSIDGDVYHVYRITVSDVMKFYIDGKYVSTISYFYIHPFHNLIEFGYMVSFPFSGVFYLKDLRWISSGVYAPGEEDDTQWQVKYEADQLPVSEGSPLLPVEKVIVGNPSEEINPTGFLHLQSVRDEQLYYRKSWKASWNKWWKVLMRIKAVK
jgi:hypothetical protein